MCERGEDFLDCSIEWSQRKLTNYHQFFFESNQQLYDRDGATRYSNVAFYQ